MSNKEIENVEAFLKCVRNVRLLLIAEEYLTEESSDGDVALCMYMHMRDVDYNAGMTFVSCIFYLDKVFTSLNYRKLNSSKRTPIRTYIKMARELYLKNSVVA